MRNKLALGIAALSLAAAGAFGAIREGREYCADDANRVITASMVDGPTLPYRPNQSDPLDFDPRCRDAMADISFKDGVFEDQSADNYFRIGVENFVMGHLPQSTESR